MLLPVGFKSVIEWGSAMIHVLEEAGGGWGGGVGGVGRSGEE